MGVEVEIGCFLLEEVEMEGPVDFQWPGLVRDWPARKVDLSF